MPDRAGHLGMVVDSNRGSLSFRICRNVGFSVLDELETEVFFGPCPPHVEGPASVLVAPLECDGFKFGSLLVYPQIAEQAFDSVEPEFWRTASTLVGLSLHWRALRRKLMKQNSD